MKALLHCYKISSAAESWVESTGGLNGRVASPLYLQSKNENKKESDENRLKEIVGVEEVGRG